jgi:CRISPR-associated protein Cas2
MAEPRHWYLVCYDIRCPKRWRKAYKLIEGYGDRLQYSIFRCWLTQRTREKMRWQLEKILTQEDDLILIRLSHQCVRDLPAYNRPNTWLVNEGGFRLL